MEKIPWLLMRQDFRALEPDAGRPGCGTRGAVAGWVESWLLGGCLMKAGGGCMFDGWLVHV